MSLYLRQLPLGPMDNFVYLLGDETTRDCWVVDPAWDVEAILQQVRSDKMTLRGALLTHAHFDHGNGLAPLLKVLDVPIYVNQEELGFLSGGAPQGLFVPVPSAAQPVRGGDTLALGHHALTFLHTPGHTPGSQCFLVDGQLISGDTLFLGTCGRCDMPGGNPDLLFDSLHRQLARLPDETILWPGHNYSSRGTHATLKEEKTKNRFLTLSTVEELRSLVGL